MFGNPVNLHIFARKHCLFFNVRPLVIKPLKCVFVFILFLVFVESSTRSKINFQSAEMNFMTINKPRNYNKTSHTADDNLPIINETISVCLDVFNIFKKKSILNIFKQIHEGIGTKKNLQQHLKYFLCQYPKCQTFDLKFIENCFNKHISVLYDENSKTFNASSSLRLYIKRCVELIHQIEDGAKIAKQVVNTSVCDVSHNKFAKRRRRQTARKSDTLEIFVNDTFAPENFLVNESHSSSEYDILNSKHVTHNLDYQTSDISFSTFTQRKQGKLNVIYIHGLFEESGRDCRSQIHAGPYELLAAQLAISHINQRNVIPGYQLEMYNNDTKCDSGVAVDSFFYYLYRLPTMLMVLGTGSSEVTEQLARVASRWNVIQISYGASSPALSERNNFPFFFRTFAPDSSHNAAIIAFIQHHRWDTVAAIHEQGDNHALPMTKLISELEQANISISLAKEVSERDYKEHLQELKEQDCRIIIGSFSLSLVRKIFCQIYNLEMFGAEYAWILQGDLKEPWWTETLGTDCTKYEIGKATQGVIVVGSHYGLDGNSTSVSGNTIDDILRSINFETDAKNSGFVGQTYDGVWAMSLALQQIQTIWNEEGRNTSLNDFSYDNYEMAAEITTTLNKLTFTGVSGPVSFCNSDRVGITSFHQNQGGDKNPALVCLHYPHSDELNFDCQECVNVEWQGDRVPIARRIIRLRVAVLDRSVMICITSLAAFGVILALTFLSFNLYFRRLKFIKLSSPNLNNFVVVGCVLVYVAMILLGMDHGSLTNDSHFGFICTARAFLLSGGFSLAFGCMFIKMYRVYHIFIRSNSGIIKSKLLHDKQLLGLVGVLVLMDCFLVTLWVTLDPMERQLRNLTMQVNPLERNVVYLYQREQCYSVHMVKWLGSLYIYKGLLLVVGCYMAWETRHVKVPALNDSQYIGMSVYNVVITSVIIVALANVIPVDRYTLTLVLVSTLIFVSTTMTLCLLFLPKIHTILTKSDDGGAVVATPGVKVEFRTRRFALDEARESMYRAEVLNRALKRELLELEEELTRLSEKMGIIPPDLHKSKRKESLERKQQDDDSDDDLPPWLDEYKKYPPNGNSSVWFTGESGSRPGACFSVLSAVHPFLISTAECSTSKDQHERVSVPPQMAHESQQSKLSSPFVNMQCIDDIRSSLPSMLVANANDKIIISSLKTVTMSISDKALNRIKHPRKRFPSENPVPVLTKTHSDIGLKVKQYSKSTTRLINGWNSCGKISSIDRPSASLSKISAAHRSISALSEATLSCASEWTTAPLYSSSFATAPESAGFSSNNPTLITPCVTPDLQRLPRDSLTDSSNGFFTSDDSYGNNGKLDGNCHRSRLNSKETTEIFLPLSIVNNEVTVAEYISDDPCSTPVVSEISGENNIQINSEDDEKHECKIRISELVSTISSPGSSQYTKCDDSTSSSVSYVQNPNMSSSSSSIKDDVFPDDKECPLEMCDLACNEDSQAPTEGSVGVVEGDVPSIENSLSNISENCSTESAETALSMGNNNSLVLSSCWTSDLNDNAKPSSAHNDSVEDEIERGNIISNDGDENCDINTQRNNESPLTNDQTSSRDNNFTQYENLRQIFQIERELILLELERSESVDL